VANAGVVDTAAIVSAWVKHHGKARVYAYGQGGTGLWMHGRLPQFTRSDTLILLTDSARFDE